MFFEKYIYLQPFTTDAIRTCYYIWCSRFGAVSKQDTEVLTWLKGPPTAVLILPTKLVAEVDIISPFEVDRVFLKCGSF